MFLSIKSIWFFQFFYVVIGCLLISTSLEGGTTIGCLHGRSAPRAPFVRTWFFILRISPQRRRSWDGSWSEGRDLSRPWGTSGKRRGWVLDCLCMMVCDICFKDIWDWRHTLSVLYYFLSWIVSGKRRRVDCQILFYAQPKRHWQAQASVQERLWNVWLHMALNRQWSNEK